MKIRFKKITSVDYHDANLGEMTEKCYQPNQEVEVKVVQEPVNGFLDLYFGNGDLAIGINKSLVEVIKTVDKPNPIG